MIDHYIEVNPSVYNSIGYMQGKHEGMCNIIGVALRENSKGKSFEEIIDIMMEKINEHDKHYQEIMLDNIDGIIER